MPAPLHRDADAFVFATPTGRPVDRDRFTAQHWRRGLRAADVRPRKFYATRHTFISLAMTKGMPLKLLATYCGTSVEMIEQHYGKWLSDDMGRWLEHVTAKPAADEPIAAQIP
jgi:integrase